MALAKKGRRTSSNKKVLCSVGDEAVNSIQFEIDYEHRLIELFDKVNSGNYYPGKSIAFIIDNPIKREVFAADFTDGE